MSDSHSPLRLFVVAGEASGDQLGAAVIEGIKKHHVGSIEISGVGGEQMTAQGMQSIFPMQELSVMGIMEILPKIFSLLKRIKQTAKAIEEFKPDIVITVDAPDFCFRVVKQARKKLKKDLPKFVHYVAPTVWAWRPKRAKKLASLYDRVLCLFPFEPLYFEKEGLSANYVGHPVTQAGFDKVGAKSARDYFGIGDEDEVLCLLFGSRQGELKRHGDVFAKVAQNWVSQSQNRTILIQTLPHLRPKIKTLCEPFKDNVVISDTGTDKAKIFAASDMALAVSGTIGLELAVANVPHVIGYKANPVTFAIFKKLAKIDFAHLANIMLGREVVPEFIQTDFTTYNISQALSSIDFDGQRNAFDEIRSFMALPNKNSPGDVAAKAVLDTLK